MAAVTAAAGEFVPRPVHLSALIPFLCTYFFLGSNLPKLSWLLFETWVLVAINPPQYLS